jgi:hypothetical protein
LGATKMFSLLPNAFFKFLTDSAVKGFRKNNVFLLESNFDFIQMQICLNNAVEGRHRKRLSNSRLNNYVKEP